MHILHSLFNELKKEFIWSRKGKERSSLFIYTLLAIIIPFISSRTSSLFRTLETLFGFVGIKKKPVKISMGTEYCIYLSQNRIYMPFSLIKKAWWQDWVSRDPKLLPLNLIKNNTWFYPFWGIVFCKSKLYSILTTAIFSISAFGKINLILGILHVCLWQN